MADRRKILIVVDWYLPAVKAGGPVRSIAAIVEMLKPWYDFSVVTSDRDLGSVVPFEGLLLDQWTSAPDGTRAWYVARLSPFSATFNQILDAESPDYVYVNGIFSEFSRNAIRLAKKKGIPVLLAPRGMLGKGALKIKSVKKRAFLFYARLRSLYSGVRWHASSEIEKSEILNVFPDANVEVAINLTQKVESGKANMSKVRNELNLIFLSRISRKKNLKFALELLKNHDPALEIHFDIYGPIEDETYWKECQIVVKNLPPNIQVVYHGTIQHDEVVEAMGHSHVLLFPTYHENFGHVIIEALGCGVPVLISNQTPWKNLAEHKAGWDLPLDDPKAFAYIIDKVAKMDESELAEWRRGAKEFALRYSNDEKLIGLNRNLFS